MGAADELIAEYGRVGGIAFPGSRQAQGAPWNAAIHAVNEATDHATWDQPLGSFFYTVRYHTDFAPEWPVAIDWPAAVRALRRSLRVSQVDFAVMCDIGSATVERWEAGRTVPFRGDALQLLTLVKRHITTPVQAGQALNLAAAAVLPNLTRPTAEYSGRDVAAWLKKGRLDHSDLASGLVGALVAARILTPIEAADEPLDATYFPLASRLHQSTGLPEWALPVVRDLEGLAPSDRKLALSLVRRLAGLHGRSDEVPEAD